MFFLQGQSKISKSSKPAKTLILGPAEREELKNPLGHLIKGTPDQTMGILKQLIQEQRPPKIIAVGDMVSNSLIEYSVPVNVIVVDNKIVREEIKPIRTTAETILKVKNPAGTLSPEAWDAIEKALKSKGLAKILVDGEEDLFTLVAVALAPENAFVIYGQPGKGLVAVPVNKEARRKTQIIIDAMQASVEKAK